MEVLETREKILGTGHSDTLAIVEDLAHTMECQGHVTKALRLRRVHLHLLPQVYEEAYPKFTSHTKIVELLALRVANASCMIES